MALTYGFFNSLDGDRKYNAKQFGSIFDGVIEDGVYMSIGGQLMVKTANDGMNVNIQTGRAWFNHTWTLNDSIYVLELPAAEPLLSKYIAVVLEVNESTGTRANSFKYVEGTPASSPAYPTLTNDDYIHQYPLAYVLIKPGATTISNANITNMVGTSSCPYVTGVVSSMDIDDLVAQWETEWNEWLAENNSEYEEFKTEYSDFRTNFVNFINDAETEFQTFMDDNEAAFTNFVEAKDEEFDTELETMKSNFGDFWEDFKAGMQEYLEAQETIWETWFSHIQGQLSEDAATNLQKQIDALAYAFVLENRAVLGVTAFVVQNKVVFGSWGSVTDNKAVIANPAS